MKINEIGCMCVELNERTLKSRINLGKEKLTVFFLEYAHIL